MENKSEVSKKNKSSIIAIIVVAIVAVLLAAYFFFFKDMLNKTYKAVFLDNNEVYFGKMSRKDGNYVNLKDVYYLQITQTTKQDANGQAYQEPGYNIIKMGTEIHGPKNEMEIPKEHILFMQDLDKTSNVLKVIQQYGAQSQLQQAPQAQTPVTNTPVTNTPVTNTPVTGY